MKRNFQVANKKDSAQEASYPNIVSKTGINLRITPLASAIAMIVSGAMMPAAYANIPGAPAAWTQYDGTAATTGDSLLYKGENEANLENNENIVLTGPGVPIDDYLYLTSGVSDTNASNNTFTNSGTFEATANPAPTFGLSSGVVYNMTNTNTTANNNTFTNSGNIYSTNGSINITGGVVYSAGNAEASNNTVNLTGGQIYAADEGVISIAGGYVETLGDKATANGNTVNIATNLSAAEIDGGGAISNGTANADNNTVIIGNGTYTNVQIFGGVAIGHTTASASNNTIYVHGNADLSEAYLNGGQTVGSNCETLNNTLVFGYNNTAWTPSNYTIAEAENFSTIRFSNVTWNKTITIQTLRSEDPNEPATYVDATKVAFSGVSSLAAQDSYKMLEIGTIENTSLALTSEKSTFTVGTALEGTGTVKLSEDGKSVTYTVDATHIPTPTPDPDNPSSGSDSGTPVVITDSLRASAQSHGVAMAMSAGTVALNAGADTSSQALLNLASSGSTGVQAFSSIGGGAMRVNTGSHVNLNTLNFSVGVGNNSKTDLGLLSVGVAFEAGFGTFKNHFDAGIAELFIKKTGHVNYYGVAGLVNMTFDNLWHVNGALRVGKMETSQNSALYNPATMQTYDIKLKSGYIGTELGLGKIIKFSDSDSVDVYGKYFFLYQQGDKFNAGEDRYKVNGVTSHRLRLAGRYIHAFTPTTSLYAGLGAEYEFDGKASYEVYGIKGDSSKTDGLRGYGELGVSIKPAQASGLSFDIGLKGLCGDGFSGGWATMDIKYLF